ARLAAARPRRSAVAQSPRRGVPGAGRDQPGRAVVSTHHAAATNGQGRYAAPARRRAELSDAAGGPPNRGTPAPPTRRPARPGPRAIDARRSPICKLRSSSVLSVPSLLFFSVGSVGSVASLQHFPRHTKQIFQTKRFGEPAAARVLEEPFRVGARHIAGHEE